MVGGTVVVVVVVVGGSVVVVVVVGGGSVVVVVVVGGTVVVVVTPGVTVSVPAESFQCWNGFQPAPNIPILIVYEPTAWLAGMFHLAVNLRFTPLVNDWLSQYCWNTLPVELWISKSTRPRRVEDDLTLIDTVAVVPRAALADARVAFVVHPAVVSLAASTPSRGIVITEPKAATRAATAMTIGRRLRPIGVTPLDDAWGDICAPSVESRRCSSSRRSIP
jgi:hypothetical protein